VPNLGKKIVPNQARLGAQEKARQINVRMLKKHMQYRAHGACKQKNAKRQESNPRSGTRKLGH
jgi:hypothetical protein